MTENTEQLSRLSTTPQVSSAEPTTISTRMKYYDLKKNWHRVKPHLADDKLNDILVRDFNKFTFGRWGRKFTYGDLPCEFESCDWDIDHRGRRPAFWQYVKHSASLARKLQSPLGYARTTKETMEDHLVRRSLDRLGRR
jgi:hypothetical protein